LTLNNLPDHGTTYYAEKTDSSTNTVTIHGNNKNIMEASSYVLRNQYDYIFFIYNGTRYNAINKNSRVRTETMTGNLSFTSNYGEILKLDPGGSARNLIPYYLAQFYTGYQLTIINTADAAETITFEPTFTTSGSHDGDNNVSILTDSGESWAVNQLVNRTISNTTDGSSGTITANTATTVTATLSGGTDNDWDTNDNYTITPAGLNQAIAQNERAIFVYDGTGWIKIFVG